MKALRLRLGDGGVDDGVGVAVDDEVLIAQFRETHGLLAASDAQGFSKPATLAVSVGGSKGFTDLSWSIAAGVFFFLTVFTLSLALKNIDVGIGYAVWTGIGSSGAAVVSAFLLDQPLTPARVLWLAVIIGGVVWLKLASSPKHASGQA